MAVLVHTSYQTFVHSSEVHDNGQLLSALLEGDSPRLVCGCIFGDQKEGFES